MSEYKSPDIKGSAARRQVLITIDDTPLLHFERRIYAGFYAWIEKNTGEFVIEITMRGRTSRIKLTFDTAEKWKAVISALLDALSRY